MRVWRRRALEVLLWSPVKTFTRSEREACAALHRPARRIDVAITFGFRSQYTRNRAAKPCLVAPAARRISVANGYSLTDVR